VEVMIALVILLIVFMGLLQASMLTIEHNTKNEIRDAGVSVGSGELAIIRATPFSALTPGSWTTIRVRTVRNFNMNYNILKTVWTTNDIAQIGVTVDYTWKSSNSNFTLSTLVRNK